MYTIYTCIYEKTSRKLKPCLFGAFENIDYEGFLTRQRTARRVKRRRGPEMGDGNVGLKLNAIFIFVEPGLNSRKVKRINDSAWVAWTAACANAMARSTVSTDPHSALPCTLKRNGKWENFWSRRWNVSFQNRLCQFLQFLRKKKLDSTSEDTTRTTRLFGCC